MRRLPYFIVLIFSVIVLSLFSITLQAYAQFPDPFTSLDNWHVVTGFPQIDSSTGSPAPSAKFDDTVDGNSTFGKGTDSMYLSNPSNTNFRDGDIDFSLYFDNDPGFGDVAVITFRMLDSDTYYAALLSNSERWSSTFAIVRQGQVNSIGDHSSVQLLPTRSWSHVTLLIRGSQFSALMDNRIVFSAQDSSWDEGKWGGVGVYSEYYGGKFHIDNFGLGNTSNPLTFRSPFTSTITSFTTFTTETTQVSTSISIEMSTAKSTTVSPVVQGEVTKAYSTEYVPVFSPALNWSLLEQLAVFLIGVGYGIFADSKRDRESLELAIVAGVAIVGVYLWFSQAQGLVALWPLFSGILLGIFIRVYRTRARVQ